MSIHWNIVIVLAVIKRGTITARNGSVCPETATDILHGYDPKNVFNMDETWLFFKALPDKILCNYGDRCRGGNSPRQAYRGVMC